MNPLVFEAACSVSQAILGTLGEVWWRDDAAEILEAFLDDRLIFVIGRDGIEWRVKPC